MSNTHIVKSGEHKSNYFRNIYTEFLRKFGTTIDVDALLPQLVINKAIRPGDREAIATKTSARDKELMLLTEILPGKDVVCHQAVVNVLVEQQKRTLAKFLIDRIDGLVWPPPESSLYSHTPDFYELEVRILGDKIPQTRVKISAEKYAGTLQANGIGNGPRYQTGTTSSIGHSHPHGYHHPVYHFVEKRALLISNETFANSDCHRIGGEVDYENMKSLLLYLGYRLTSHRNLTAEQMLECVIQFSASDNKLIRISYVTVLLTHGTVGAFYGVDGKTIQAKALFDPLVNSSALRGCPKIFIIQACRDPIGQNGETCTNGCGPKAHTSARVGRALSNGFSQCGQTRVGGGLNAALALIRDTERAAYQALSSEMSKAGPDTCFLFSATPGYYSWRNQKRASWFIEAVCTEFYQNARKPDSNFMKLAAAVRKRWQEIFSENSTEIELPRVVSNMNKHFHFFHSSK